jgi:hypothetical protein
VVFLKLLPALIRIARNAGWRYALAEIRNQGGLHAGELKDMTRDANFVFPSRVTAALLLILTSIFGISGFCSAEDPLTLVVVHGPLVGKPTTSRFPLGKHSYTSIWKSPLGTECAVYTAEPPSGRDAYIHCDTLHKESYPLSQQISISCGSHMGAAKALSLSVGYIIATGEQENRQVRAYCEKAAAPR